MAIVLQEARLGPWLHALPQTAASGSLFLSHDAPTHLRGRRAACGCQQPPLPVPPSARGCEVSHPRDSRCQRMPGSGPGLRVGGHDLGRAAAPVCPKRLRGAGQDGGLQRVTLCPRDNQVWTPSPFLWYRRGSAKAGVSALPSPGAPRLLSTPRATRRLNPCDRRGRSAASRESGPHRLCRLLAVLLEGSGTREGCWGAGLWDLGGSRRGGEARPRFQLGKRAGLVLAGISVRHEPSP